MIDGTTCLSTSMCVGLHVPYTPVRLVPPEQAVERGIGSVKRLELHSLPREGGWDYIYLNDNVQGS
jgi:hypothetical protein